MLGKSLGECVGNTPLVRLQRMGGDANRVMCKLENLNTSGSHKDRAIFAMIAAARRDGHIIPGDTLIEATSGNSGVALSMAAAALGYRTICVMPEDVSAEKRAMMRAYGANVVLSRPEAGLPGAIETAREMDARGVGFFMDQFSSPDNVDAHSAGTAAEIWRDCDEKIDYFVGGYGSTATLMGAARYLKERRREMQVIQVVPELDERIAGLEAWPDDYIPLIFVPDEIDEMRFVTQQAARDTSRQLARQEGILAGISTGASLRVALDIVSELEERGENGATIVILSYDRGEHYISTKLFD